MNKLFTEDEFELSRYKDMLPLSCEFCNNAFYRSKERILIVLKGNSRKKHVYCSQQCSNNAKGTSLSIECENCHVLFVKQRSQIEKTKNNFCSQSCAATYNNTHKTKGTRRSKLEAFLEVELTKLYPDLEMHFNRKDTINSELDIYIPSLKLAFELNGIFHYEPIYGAEKLLSIQNNDNRKFQACLERGIELCIIDSSKMLYFKPEKGFEVLEIITDILKIKM